MRSFILIMSLFASYLLSGCSSGDSPAENNPSSGGMSIGVSLPDSDSVATRVVETADAIKGIITTWESTDSLRVFHKYTKNGIVGTMQGFKFTSTGTGSNTTFAYGVSGYSFTPGNSLYSFNALPTSGNYTKAYNSSNNNFTLSLSGYGSQDGTVANLKNYDAMYGISSVGTGGTPAAMTMKHLMSVIRFDLSNPAFIGTLTSVTFTCSSATTSILPSSGSFTLSNAGVVTSNTLTASTSWTVSNIAASSGTASVYLATLPFQSISGTLNIVATASDGNTYSREITLNNVNLVSGRMNTYKVALSNESNSYIMPPLSTIYIPVSRASTANSANFSTTDAFTTGVLWADGANIAIPSVVGRYIKVTTGLNEGNAVVYAKKGTTIVWSWHIWITSYNPSTTNVTYNGKIWMDRNLGAMANGTGTTAYGLYYQWGRKDPFPGGTNGSSVWPSNGPTVYIFGTPPTSYSGPVTLATAIQNPNIFYKNSTSPYDWLSTQSDVLWNNSGKTFYDPCPQGWRVPLNTEFSGVFASNTLSGYWNLDGTFSNTGGRWWSGVNSSTKGYYLYSNGAVVSSNRTTGMSVRCVKN